MKPFALDTSALVVLLENRRGADKVRELLGKALDSQHPLYMSAVNWGEVYYVIWRNHGRIAADETIGKLEKLPIIIQDADRAMARQAATFHARFALPYADGFAAAIALQRDARLITTDSDFEKVKSEIRLLRLS